VADAPRTEPTDLSALSFDELYARLAGELDIDRFGADDFKLMRARAETWLRANRDELRRRVCPLVQEYGEAAVDVSALVDAVSTLVGWPAGVTVVAIILKIGASRFCDGYTE
jgi:hypothetical protein